MDLKQEIKKHLDWIEAVASLLGDSEMSDDEIQKISRYDQCALGQWLSTKASTDFSDMPKLDELNEAHKAFHQLAGNCILALQQGNEAEMMELQQQFLLMSQKVISSLNQLQEKNQ